MPSVTVHVADPQYDSLQIAAAAIAVSVEDFVQIAISRAIGESDLEFSGPVQAIRSSQNAYKDAMPPFLILEIVRGGQKGVERKFNPPLPLTRSNLLKLQSEGVDLVNIRLFTNDYPREPDFAISQLLGLPRVLPT